MSQFPTDCFLCRFPLSHFQGGNSSSPLSLFFSRWPQDRGNGGCLDLSSGSQVPGTGALLSPASETGRGTCRGLRYFLGQCCFPVLRWLSQRVCPGRDPWVVGCGNVVVAAVKDETLPMALLPLPQGDFLVEGQLPRFILTRDSQVTSACQPQSAGGGVSVMGTATSCPCLFVGNFTVVKYTSHLPSEPV